MIEIYHKFVIPGPFLIVKRDKEKDVNDQENVLILSDCHFGYSDYLIQKGVFSLIEENKKINEIIDVCKGFNINYVIFNGDVLHDFGSLSYNVEKKLNKLKDFFESSNIEYDFIKGNHDTFLKFYLRKINKEEKEFIILDDIFITHGHREYKIPEDINFLVLGHEHPAIVVNDQKFKSFLVCNFGKFQKQKLIVMPSFFDFVEGTNLDESSSMSAYKKGDVLLKIIIEKINNKYLVLPYEDASEENSSEEDSQEDSIKDSNF